MTTIKVTQEDIDKGQSCEADKCAVALAVNRVLKPECEALVNAYKIAIFTREELDILSVYHEEVVRKFVSDFDGGKPVKPFSFEIEIPERSLK